MTDKKKPNSADGRDSYDSTSSGELIQFFNKNVTPYPTEVGGPAFDLIPVEKQKDIMVNVARMHAKQEYSRIMELVAVLQRQADEVRKRVDITDLVHAAKYTFQIYHGQCYWLAYDRRRDHVRAVRASAAARAGRSLSAADGLATRRHGFAIAQSRLDQKPMRGLSHTLAWGSAAFRP